MARGSAKLSKWLEDNGYGFFTGDEAVDEAIRLLDKKPKGMTVQEAGRKGGLTVRDERGHEFYEEIGRKGGHKTAEYIRAGRRALERR